MLNFEMAGLVPAIFVFQYFTAPLSRNTRCCMIALTQTRNAMRKFYLIVIAVAALMTASSAFTAEIPIPPPISRAAPKDIPVHANQPHCSRWTDECVNCARGADGEAPVCSNIGIACQPKAIRCLSGDIAPAQPPK